MSDIIPRVKEKIKNYDELLKLFNMNIEKLTSGYSEVSMNIDENHTNAAGVCHGGVIFSLADVAFALASNSHGNIALGMDVCISFIKAVKPNTKIKAICREIHRGKRTGHYAIEIKDNKNNLISFVKATAFRLEDPLI